MSADYASVISRLVGARGPFELEERHVAAGVTRTFRNGPHTIPEIFKRAARFPAHNLISWRGRDTALQEILTVAAELAHALREDGEVCKGRRVAIVLPNSPEWVAAFAAVTSSGATAVLVERDRSSDELRFALNTADCSAAIVGQDDHAVRIAVQSAGVHVIAVEPNAPRSRSDLPALAVDPASLAVVSFTSGTTGRQKAVAHTHASLLSGLKNMMLGAAILSMQRETEALPASRQKACTLVLSPFANIAGLSQVLLALMILGVIVLPEFGECDEAAQLIAAKRVRAVSGATPDMLRRLLQNKTGADFGSLSNFFLHGSTLQPNLVAAIESALPNASISTGYGMTETSGAVAVANLQEIKRRPGAAGRVLPSVDIAFAPSRAAGAPEEMLLRGPMLMAGYLDKDRLTGIHDGWFATGDVGAMDAEGYLHIVDRFKNFITINGAGIAATEIELAAAADDCVEEAAVFALEAVPTDRIRLAVVPKEGRVVDPTRLRALLEKFVPSRLLEIVPCASIPRTRAGKIDRQELARWAVNAER